MTYEQLLNEAQNLGLEVKEKPLESSDGRTYINKIAIRCGMPTVRKACVLAEELGHCFTSTGDILAQNSLDAIKQERRARIWAFKQMLSVEQVYDAASKGYTLPYEMADYLDVDEEFLLDYLAWQGILDISL